MSNVWHQVAAVALPLVAGTATGLFTKDDIVNWADKLKRPSFDPPNWVFGPAWTVLYILMGLASYRVWTHGGWAAQSRPLTLYLVQLALNLAWPLIFFRGHRIGLALVDNLALLGTTAATASAFRAVDPTAANLLVPYLAWLAFANVLNFAVWRLNSKAGDNGSGRSGATPAMAALGLNSTAANPRNVYTAKRAQHAHVLPSTRRPSLLHSRLHVAIGGWPARTVTAQRVRALAMSFKGRPPVAHRRAAQLRGGGCGMSASSATAVACCF